ncbi:hypothetical protein OAC41_03370, partial [Acidimicrobiales bacterium]|nr:hypothetical protein [Acidimicrobiales bacterium]
MSTNPEVITPQVVNQPSQLVHQQYQPGSAVRAAVPRPSTSRGLQRRLNQTSGQAVMRAADVAAEGRVAVQKTREVQNVIEHVMLSHAMNSNMAQTLAQGDPFLADDLNGIAAVGRMSM